jgi:pimeloyl-ACP methyl ester carboxylesterase
MTPLPRPSLPFTTKFNALRFVVVALVFLVLPASSARAQSVCDPDGFQESGSIYRICMPTTGYNNMLVVWAHGFQHAGTRVSIPEDQLCINGFCLPELVNSLGFAFATNSYSKTGLAVLQGKADIVDLVNIFKSQKGAPTKVYLIGASEGGLITALNLEQRPDVFAAGVAACGPIGDFPSQINFFGDARATFEYFFPGLIPGDPFHPDPAFVAVWNDYYQNSVKPFLLDPAHRHQLDQWVTVAKLPFDANNYLPTVEQSFQDALRYSVTDLTEGATTLGGFPFDNRFRWYSGSDNDFLLNIQVPRVGADAAAITQMTTFYNTTGVLARPLMSLHTLRDQQVPYWHEQIYDWKTFWAGSFLSRHLEFPVDRYGHCNFTQDEALFSFAVMLLYDGVLDFISGTASFLSPTELTAFEARAAAVGLKSQRDGSKLIFKLKTK